MKPDPAQLFLALTKAAVIARSAERDVVWAEHYDPGKLPAVQSIRDEAIRSIERVLSYAARQHVITARGARNLAALCYAGLAASRRHVMNRSFADEPQGYWQSVEVLEKSLKKEWRWDRIRRLLMGFRS